MTTESPERLTTADRFAALKDSLDWYLPRLLDGSVEGQVARGAATDSLQKQADADKDRGVDLIARGLIAGALIRYGAENVKDNLMRLFRCLSPDEVAQLIDASTPPVELEERGSAVEALGKLDADHAEQTGSEADTYLIDPDDKDVLESAMPFSEGSRSKARNTPLHVSPVEAERLYQVMRGVTR
jgi:hypothetical protein